MHRVDNSRFLLYLEFDKELKSNEPIVDEITRTMQLALDESTSGGANYRSVGEEEHFNDKVAYKGFHSTECGRCSSNQDYLLKNGMITNSLCVYYLEYYRDSIPDTEMVKVKRLINFYKNYNV